MVRPIAGLARRVSKAYQAHDRIISLRPRGHLCSSDGSMRACMTAFSKSGFMERFGPLAWIMNNPTIFSFGSTQK
jgi:hypothetical protein